jgi:hypothetical protein
MRTAHLNKHLTQINLQDSLYNLVINYHIANKEIPDSLSLEFINAVSNLIFDTHNTSFEKVYRESYQMWQVLDQDELAKMTEASYDLTNIVEDYCKKSNEQIWQKMGQCQGAGHAFVTHKAKELTEALINNEDFCFYMSSRGWTTLAMNDIYKAQCDYMEKIDSICQALNYNIKGYEVHYLND